MLRLIHALMGSESSKSESDSDAADGPVFVAATALLLSTPDGDWQAASATSMITAILCTQLSLPCPEGLGPLALPGSHARHRGLEALNQEDAQQAVDRVARIACVGAGRHLLVGERKCRAEPAQHARFDLR